MSLLGWIYVKLDLHKKFIPDIMKYPWTINSLQIIYQIQWHSNRTFFMGPEEKQREAGKLSFQFQNGTSWGKKRSMREKRIKRGRKIAISQYIELYKVAELIIICDCLFGHKTAIFIRSPSISLRSSCVGLSTSTTASWAILSGHCLAFIGDSSHRE